MNVYVLQQFILYDLNVIPKAAKYHTDFLKYVCQWY